MLKVYETNNAKNSFSLDNIKIELPSFDNLKKHYPKYGIDYANGGISDLEFAKLVGGKVQLNIEEGFFSNTCALRVSHTLNKNNHNIPKKPYVVSSSKNRKWYIYRVLELDSFLTNNYGKADIIVDKKDGQTISSSHFKNYKGIIIFDTRGTWSDATGHSTIWDGNKRLGGNYESEEYFKISNKVKLWISK